MDYLPVCLDDPSLERRRSLMISLRCYSLFYTIHVICTYKRTTRYDVRRAFEISYMKKNSKGAFIASFSVSACLVCAIHKSSRTSVTRIFSLHLLGAPYRMRQKVHNNAGRRARTPRCDYRRGKYGRIFTTLQFAPSRFLGQRSLPRRSFY